MTLVKDDKRCNGCPLREKFPDRTLVPPQLGPSNSLRLVVAEAAGAEEEVQGLPLVGPSGRIFDSWLRKAGIHREQLSIANVLSCRPPSNIFPTDSAARVNFSESEGREVIEHCRERFLQPLLTSRPWERIDAIGEKSLRQLTGFNQGIMQGRGVALPLKGETKPRVIGTLHPSYTMRDQSRIPDCISDLQKGIQVPPQYYNLQPTLEELSEYKPTKAALDIETNRFTNQISMVGFSDRLYSSIVVPYSGSYILEIRRIIEGLDEVITQNGIGFDMPTLAINGIHLKPECQEWDVMLLDHLIRPDAPERNLEYLASIWTQMGLWKHLSKEQPEFYNACDVDATFQIFEAIYPVLKAQNLIDLYKYTTVPLAKICRLMSETGIKTDANRARAAREKFLAEIVEIEKTLPAELQPYDKPIRVRKPAPEGTIGKSGKPIKFIHEPGVERIVPWNSPTALGHWLYETMQYPKQLHPKTKKVTTDHSALERLFRKTKNPELDALRRIKKISELTTSFLKADDAASTIPVGRVHTNFLVHGTNTGRLASSSPNMQNQPVQARYVYVPSFSDWCFTEADFESLENRLAAWYANDSDRLGRLAIPGFNEHRWLTSQIYGIPESEITKDMWQYKRGKNTNHGADGAMGPRKLAMTYDIPEKEAKELLLKWRTINHKSAQWQEQVGNRAVKEGVLTTAFSRKRWFWSTSAYTEGIRFLIQSSGADISFRSMIGLYYERIGWPEELARIVSPVLAPLPRPARLLLQVHDSLLVEHPLCLSEEVRDCMKRVMTQNWRELAGFSIPVEFKVGNQGDSWAELLKGNYIANFHKQTKEITCYQESKYFKSSTRNENIKTRIINQMSG